MRSQRPLQVGGEEEGRCEQAAASSTWGVLAGMVCVCARMCARMCVYARTCGETGQLVIESGDGASNRGLAVRHLAVGETVILLHPPSTFSRCFNMDKNGGVIKMTVSPTASVTANPSMYFGWWPPQPPALSL